MAKKTKPTNVIYNKGLNEDFKAQNTNFAKPESPTLQADSSQFKGKYTAAQKKLWDETRGIRLDIDSGTRPDSKIFLGLYENVIFQQVEEYYDGHPEIMTCIGRENWANALAEYISYSQTVLEKVTDPRAPVALTDFTAPEPEMRSDVVQADTIMQGKIRVPANGWIDVFTNPRVLETFVKGRVLSLANTWKTFFFNEKMKVLLQYGTRAITFNYDKTIDLGDETTTDFTKNALKKARQYVLSLQTPSKSHLALNRDLWIYSNNSIKNLVMLVSSEFRVEMDFFYSTAFNRDDVIINIEKATVDFSLLDGVTADDRKKKFIIVDRRAVRFGKAVNQLSKTVVLPKIEDLFIQWEWFGFARLPVYPIAVFKSA